MAIGEILGGAALVWFGGGGTIAGVGVSATGIGAAIGVPAVAVSAGLVTAGVANMAAGIYGLGKALTTGGGVSAGPAAPSGQLHHPISKTIHEALEKHPILKGKYKARDPRFVTRAADKDAHNGYQHWHINIDKEVANWIRTHKGATPEAFEAYLRGLYSKPPLSTKFPNGF
jgi:hypothetical protein